jgi:hypothetical protein
MTEKTENYRGYVLVARVADFGARCWAWKDKLPVHKKTGGTVNEAILAARRAIDEEFGTRQRLEGDVDVAYTEALAAVLPRLTIPQLRMLQAHYHAPNRTITTEQLAEAAGYASFSGANLQYGIVGRAILERYRPEVGKRPDGTPVFTIAPGDEGRMARHGDIYAPKWTWKMLPALAYALQALGIVSDK